MWFSRLRTTLFPRRLDQDLDEELRAHLEARIEENMRAGMTEKEARHAAARQFGNATSIKERARDRDILVWLETALKDLRHALRGLRRSPGFAITAILSLALGIGANTALFSILDALLIKALPVDHPEQLLWLRIHNGKSTQRFSLPLYDYIRSHAQQTSGMFGSTNGGPEIEEHGEKVSARVQYVSASYFDVLGTTAWRGRLFRDRDMAGEPLAVISYSFWHSHYAGNPSAVGARIRVNDRDFTITGVADPKFHGNMLEWPTEVWVPIEQVLPANHYLRGSNYFWLDVTIRARPGVSKNQAREEAALLFHQYLEQSASGVKWRSAQQRAAFLDQRLDAEFASAGISILRDRFSKPLFVIECIVGMVLLIACANLANLMLARAAAREREIAVRQALGASRSRLIRQALIESGVVAFAGAAAALFVARSISIFLLRFLPPDDPSLLNLAFRLDPRVLGFTVSLALFTSLLFGLGPAWQASRPAAASIKRDHDWIGRALVAVEVAICLVLLLGAGLLVRTLFNLRHVDTGFDAEHVLTAHIRTPRGYQQTDLLERLDIVRNRLLGISGIRSVAFSSMHPMTDGRLTYNVYVLGRAMKPDETNDATSLSASPGFFAAVGTPLLLGRDFTEADRSGSPEVAIVNESFARKFFDGKNPIGGRFGIKGPNSSGDIEIVGVVKDAKYSNLRETVPVILYRPMKQQSFSLGAAIVDIRALGDLNSVASKLRDAVKDIDPRIGVEQVKPFTELVDRSLAMERMVAQISAAFGALALLVACIGLYGILAYRVTRRTREIGVRIALGATRRSVQWMVVRESLSLFAIGAIVGLPPAIALAGFLTSMLYGLKPSDPSTIATALAVLAIVALAAALIPARRASNVDPMTSLRCD